MCARDFQLIIQPCALSLTRERSPLSQAHRALVNIYTPAFHRFVLPFAATSERMCTYVKDQSCVYMNADPCICVCVHAGNEKSANWGELFIFALRRRKPAAELYPLPVRLWEIPWREATLYMAEVIWYNKLLNSKCSQACRIFMWKENKAIYANFCILSYGMMNIPWRITQIVFLVLNLQRSPKGTPIRCRLQSWATFLFIQFLNFHFIMLNTKYW